jgi:hypothetical protein
MTPRLVQLCQAQPGCRRSTFAERAWAEPKRCIALPAAVQGPLNLQPANQYLSAGFSVFVNSVEEANEPVKVGLLVVDVSEVTAVRAVVV